VTGAQLFWQTPVDGLRVGGTFLRTSIDFDLTLAPTTVTALTMAGLVPPDFDGTLTVSQRPDTVWIGSVEYTFDDTLIAAEYSRWEKHQETTLPAVLPAFDEDGERFYVMASHRLSPLVEAGGYYSVYDADAGDRGGHDTSKFPHPYYAFQRDLAGTIRFEINDHWLWKLEGHFLDGVADLDPSQNPSPHRYWGLFLFKTTVTF